MTYLEKKATQYEQGKDIVPFLPYYLGCLIIVTYPVEGENEQYYDEEELELLSFEDMDYFAGFPLKLVLRKFENSRAEDKKWLEEYCIKANSLFPSNENMADIVKYFCDRGIDMFNLVEKGLAVEFDFNILKEKFPHKEKLISNYMLSLDN